MGQAEACAIAISRALTSHLKTKEINQPKSSFIGAINQYRKQAGMEPQEPGHVYEKLSL